MLLLFSGNVNAEFDSTMQEDPFRLQWRWDMRMTPEEYRMAIDCTGVMSEQEKDGAMLTYWESIGPKGGFGGVPYNGRISGIKIYEEGGNHHLYVGACNGGLWSCHNITSTPYWFYRAALLENQTIRAFDIHPTNRDTIIIGTGDHGRGSGSGIYRSTNGGMTWWDRLTIPGDDPHLFYRLYYLPDKPDTVVAASSKGILWSGDGGDTWVYTSDSSTTDLVIHPGNSDVMYACSHDFANFRGVIKSTDGGVTWTKLFSVPKGVSGTCNMGRASLAICRNYPDNLALVCSQGAGCDLPDHIKAVYRSTNGGTDWHDITNNLIRPNPSDPGVTIYEGGNQIFHAQAITFHPDDPDLIYVGLTLIAKTTDGGTTDWQINAIDCGHADITQLYFAPWDDDTLWICNDGGIYMHRLSNLQTISYNGDAELGLCCSEIFWMDAERGFAGIGLQDNGIVVTDDLGESWTLANGGDGGGVEITDNQTLEFWYSAGAGGGPGDCIDDVFPTYYRTYTGGVIGSRTCVPYIDIWNPNLFYDRYSGNIYCYDGDHVYSSPVARFGTPSWTNILDLVQGKAGIFGNNITSGLIYIKDWWGPWITVCEKSGGSWSHTRYDLSTTTPGFYDLMTIAPSAQNTRECWAGLHGPVGTPKILHTENNWLTWEDLTDSRLARVKSVLSILVTPFNKDVIYVGTDVGVLRSRDGGQSWLGFNIGMQAVECWDMRYLIDTTFTGNDKLIVATYGRGVFTREVSGPPIVFVDKRNTTGHEDGTLEFPYTDLSAAIAAAPDNSIVAIHGDSYPIPDPSTVTKPLRFESYESSAVIGGGK
jgi:hypothetical protein